MDHSLGYIPADFPLQSSERRYFWWEPTGSAAVAVAHSSASDGGFASFADIRRLGDCRRFAAPNPDYASSRAGLVQQPVMGALARPIDIGDGRGACRTSLRGECCMPLSFEPHTAILPPAQREIWPQLAPAASLSSFLYGGTAIALHLGAVRSLDFDFFSAAPLDKPRLVKVFQFLKVCPRAYKKTHRHLRYPPRPGPIGEDFVLWHHNDWTHQPAAADGGQRPAGGVVGRPVATKLKAILDRARSSKDYSDIAAIIWCENLLEKSLGAFSAMFRERSGPPVEGARLFQRRRPAQFAQKRAGGSSGRERPGCRHPLRYGCIPVWEPERAPRHSLAPRLLRRRAKRPDAARARIARRPAAGLDARKEIADRAR